MKKLWIVIPGYNESRHIDKVISGCLAFTENVIVVDDGSKDKTSDVSLEQGATVLRHVINLGKGAALRTGCEYAIKQGAEEIIVIDSDGQHKPEDIPRFLDELKKADLIFSYRKFNKNMPFLLTFGNSVIKNFISFLFGIKLNDITCGFRAFKSRIYPMIKWQSRGYFVETEMVAMAGKNKVKYSQIPVDTIYHDRYKGTTVFDGIKIVVDMLLLKLNMRR